MTAAGHARVMLLGSSYGYMTLLSYGHMVIWSYGIFLAIFGRTDLRISLSEAKFDAEADFDVRSAVAPQKPDQIDEKLFFRSQKFPEKFFSVPKNEMLQIVWNAFWQILTALGLVRRVNGHSKFRKKKNVNFSLIFLTVLG